MCDITPYWQYEQNIPGYTTIGICSLCRGLVTIPSPWHGTPPLPMCMHCGAVAMVTSPYPVIPMVQNRVEVTTNNTSNT